MCTFCSQGFNRKASLVVHERKHTGDKPFKCDQCDGSFTEKRPLEVHAYRAHNIPKPDICEKCGKGFVDKGKLKSHMAVHNKVKQLECDECDSRFRSNDGLKEHKIRHELKRGEYTGSRPLCCGQVFKGEHMFKLHTQVVHEKLKPFKCDNCGNEFTRADSLRTHKLIHQR